MKSDTVSAFNLLRRLHRKPPAPTACGAGSKKDKFPVNLEGLRGAGKGAEDGELEAVVAGFVEGGLDFFVVGVAEEVGEEVILEVAFLGGAGADVGEVDVVAAEDIEDIDEGAGFVGGGEDEGGFVVAGAFGGVMPPSAPATPSTTAPAPSSMSSTSSANIAAAPKNANLEYYFFTDLLSSEQKLKAPRQKPPPLLNSPPALLFPRRGEPDRKFVFFE